MPLHTPDDVRAYLRGSGSNPTPWYGHYHRELHRSTRGLDHEMTGHPVGAVFVVQSTAPDPVVLFDELLRNMNMLSVFQRVRAAADRRHT